MRADRLIRDPVYDYIALPQQLARVVDHPIYQRLRRIAQTSLTSSVYPSATGSRFEHGLGAMRIAGLAWDAAWTNASPTTKAAFVASLHQDVPQSPVEHAEFAQLVRLTVSAVGLLHDVGHPPFSHVLEGVYQELSPTQFSNVPNILDEWQSFGGPFHEFAGELLVEELKQSLPEPLRTTLTHVYRADPDGETWASALHSIVAGEIDVDRLDYLMRDAQKAGTEFGSIDHDRLIGSLELHQQGSGYAIGPGVRARSAVETLLIQRSQQYKWITFHPHVVGSNLALTRAVSAVIDLSQALTPVRIGNKESTLGSLFTAGMPNLNYLRPRQQDVLASLGAVAAEPASEAQLAFDDQMQAELAMQLRLDLQASVDDGVVLGMLKSALVLARSLLIQATIDQAVRSKLTRLITYIQAALFRSKNFVPVWKTVEEFAGTAALMADELTASVTEVFEEVIGKFTDNDIVSVFTEQRDEINRLLETDRVVGTNSIVGSVLHQRETRELFRQELDLVRTELKGLPGYWDLEYTSFSPVRTRRHLTVLYRRESRFPLIKTSPLVQALEGVEASRHKLGAFFFLTSPGTFEPWDRDEVREAREMLAGDLMATLPTFVRRFWPSILQETVMKGQGHAA